MDAETIWRISAFPTHTNYVGGPLNVMAGVARSAKWPSFRRKHLKRQPVCQACGCDVRDVLNAHHIKPFHLFPDLELDAANVVTLCERGAFNCHWIFGHGGKSWSDWNPTVIADAEYVRGMLSHIVRGGATC